MKKNKKITYILMVIVTGLWVVVFYRIYVSFFTDKSIDIPVNNTVVKKAVKADDDNTFVLKANYQDPFLGRFIVRRAAADGSVGSGNGGSQPKPKVAPVKKEEVKIDWSFINYYGLIKNQQSNKQVALVSIQGREFMVAEGDQVDNVTFLKNFKDSIKVSYQGTTAFLRKK